MWTFACFSTKANTLLDNIERWNLDDLQREHQNQRETSKIWKFFPGEGSKQRHGKCNVVQYTSTNGLKEKQFTKKLWNYEEDPYEELVCLLVLNKFTNTRHSSNNYETWHLFILGIQKVIFFECLNTFYTYLIHLSYQIYCVMVQKYSVLESGH